MKNFKEFHKLSHKKLNFLKKELEIIKIYPQKARNFKILISFKGKIFYCNFIYKLSNKPG
ncbi:hypothetical protein CINF_1303 [Candidatus Campylobacter infans]|uniref:Uncharacterized protein n=1 Tax=Candidatus Campylobacter infans TaxID=2561898 RepID=A0A7H9CKR3_9BACT|nr:MAG: hypothetical protein CGEMS_0216 [Candidatus Campylobacter infans]QLI05788.1 hypothetical protein CINF_1303 [Candidatus Campylobacter infans]